MIGLVNNAALLLALALLYHMLDFKFRVRKLPFLKENFIGILLGGIGMAIMLNPMDFGQGVIFDTRSVLLCISGFFFGGIPTLVAMAMTAVFRLWLGGTGAWTGVTVIAASGGIGLAWRYFRWDAEKSIGAGELYLLGIVVHIVMLTCMLTLPRSVAIDVLAGITLPVMLIYPLSTLILGKLLVIREKHRRIEDELQKTSESLQAILEHSPLLINEISLDGRYLRTNAATARLLNADPSFIVGKPFDAFVPKETADIYMERISRVMAQVGPVTVEDRLSLPTMETTTYYLSTLFPLFDASGRIRSIGSIAHDITDRKIAEENLNESEKKFKSYVNNAPDGIFITDVNGRFIDVNPAASTITGYSRDDLTSMSIPDLIPLETVNEANDHFERLKRSGRSTGDVKFHTKGGDIRWWAVTAVHLDHGRYLGFCKDVTEQKQAEQALKQREIYLNKIFDVLPIGLWFADKHGKLIRGNPAGVKIWGAEPKVSVEEYGVFKARRLPSGEPIAPDDWALAHTIREGVTVKDELLEIDAFDGRKKIILNYTAPVKDDNGEMLGAIVVNNDITENKRAEKEKENLEARLRQAQKMESVGRLAGGVAHDFNNMLGVILGHTEMALEQVDPAQPLFTDLQEVRKAAERSADLTRQLLAFARKQTITPIVIDINESVEKALKMLRRLISEDIDLVWSPGQNLWPVKVDPSQIDQILANLCVNAKDAIAGVGIITIETEAATLDEAYCADHDGFAPGEYVLLAVSDNGCGMDQETLNHLFEPFFTTKQVGKGTGLGLASVYGMVKQNNGFINVHSKPGQGTTFKICLPRHAVKTTIPSPERTATQPLEHGHETILLVEDEPAILKMTIKMLERLGYNVIEAATPGEAIRLAHEHAGDIHMLMTDVVMPEMNGRDLAGNLLSIYPDLKRLFMSGYTADVIAGQGVLDEGVHFIQKPFSRAELAKKVREALSK
jgi:PAS domain S-box-containing protein